MTITIRPLKKTDHFALYPIYSNPHVTLMAGFNPVKNQLQLNQMMPSLIKEGHAILLDDKVIGVITLDDLGNKNGMLGYLLNENFWHHGYATKACELYLKKLKKDGFHTIYADCFFENIASKHILEKLHFTFLQDFERAYPDFPNPKQCHLYRIDL